MRHSTETENREREGIHVKKNENLFPSILPNLWLVFDRKKKKEKM